MINVDSQLALKIEEGKFSKGDNEEVDKGIIESESDSSAYLEAYKQFLIRGKAAQMTAAKYGFESEVPDKFTLYNEVGQEISKSVTFKNIDSLKADLFARVNNIGNSDVKVDSSAEAKLKPYFQITK